ncbi:uncharacterized protein LOC112494319 [Cephus cinctus]|uniref:Uncharacterized protein LOC112494319 n=1 Tax=Cephus cinctus TaxID=211228 RepID=A0AAJ7W121_CEPCN|nr:uncharacterized protein LOC112494319 [Cephus cinctus]
MDIEQRQQPPRGGFVRAHTYGFTRDSTVSQGGLQTRFVNARCILAEKRDGNPIEAECELPERYRVSPISFPILNYSQLPPAATLETISSSYPSESGEIRLYSRNL